MEIPNGAANTVGGHFIPSGLPSSAEFSHEPACQTGERAPQGRFRHQPEQMVHPSFWQLASFPSLPVCGEEAPYCPLRDFATLRTYSPEIKAQQAIFAFLPVYPELVGVVGSQVPDYRGIFLRGHGSQRSTHYGSVTHASTGLGELQGRSQWMNDAGWAQSSGAMNFYASRSTPVVGEVRPVNRAVRYLIRAR